MLLLEHGDLALVFRAQPCLLCFQITPTVRKEAVLGLETFEPVSAVKQSSPALLRAKLHFKVKLEATYCLADAASPEPGTAAPCRGVDLSDGEPTALGPAV